MYFFLYHCVMLFIQQHDKKMALGILLYFRILPSHTEMKKKKGTNQKLLLWLIFLQFRRNGFNSMRVLDFTCQLRTHRNAGLSIKIIDIGLYFNFKGLLSNSALRWKTEEGKLGIKGRQRELCRFLLNKGSGLCLKFHHITVERAQTSKKQE